MVALLSDWSKVPKSSEFPSLGLVLVEGQQGVSRSSAKAHSHAAAPTSDGDHEGSSAGKSMRNIDTNLARQGSNFGLPIALNLTRLMQGGIGIVEVRRMSVSARLALCALVEACSWYLVDSCCICCHAFHGHHDHHAHHAHHAVSAVMLSCSS